MNKAKQILTLILSLVIGGILIGYLFPIGMNAYHDANTTGWASNEQAIWDVLGIFLVLVIMIALAGWAITAFRE